MLDIVGKDCEEVDGVIIVAKGCVEFMVTGGVGVVVVDDAVVKTYVLLDVLLLEIDGIVVVVIEDVVDGKRMLYVK